MKLESLSNNELRNYLKDNEVTRKMQAASRLITKMVVFTLMNNLIVSQSLIECAPEENNWWQFNGATSRTSSSAALPRNSPQHWHNMAR